MLCPKVNQNIVRPKVHRSHLSPSACGSDFAQILRDSNLTQYLSEGLSVKTHFGHFCPK